MTILIIFYAYLGVQSIETDPQNVTNCFTVPVLHRDNIASAPQDLKKQISLHLMHTKIDISIVVSCDTAPLYYIGPASAARNKPRHNQFYTPTSLAEDFITIIFIQTQATEKALILKA